MKIKVDENKTKQILEAIKSGQILNIRDLSGVSFDSLNGLNPDTKINIRSGIACGPAFRFDKNFGPYGFTGCSPAQSVMNFTTVGELKNMLHLFNQVEMGIDEKWSDMEKEVYLYGILSKNFSPDASITDVHKFVNKKAGSCTNFSRVFCELSRRQGIDAFVFATLEHAFNMIKLGNNYYPVDVTVASNHKKHYFGRKDYFSLVDGIDDELSVKLDDLKDIYIDQEQFEKILNRLVPDYPKLQNAQKSNDDERTL